MQAPRALLHLDRIRARPVIPPAEMRMISGAVDYLHLVPGIQPAPPPAADNESLPARRRPSPDGLNHLNTHDESRSRKTETDEREVQNRCPEPPRITDEQRGE